MGQKILVAEPYDILRTGLRVIFVEDMRVSDVYEVATREELEAQLSSNLVDLVVVHQSLVSDITLLPPGKFIIVTTDPDPETFIEAYRHSARAYLSEKVSACVLRLALFYDQDSFVIDPHITPMLMEHFLDWN